MLQKTSIELNLKLEDVSNETINIQNIKIIKSCLHQHLYLLDILINSRASYRTRFTYLYIMR